MHQILPYSLWTGHAHQGADFSPLFEAGIQALVDVGAGEEPSRPPREFLYCRFPLLDGLGNDRKVLDLAIITLANLMERQIPTLVTCGAGMSRSPAIAAAAISLLYQEPPDDALKQVSAHSPCDVSPGLWDEIKKHLDAQRL